MGELAQEAARALAGLNAAGVPPEDLITLKRLRGSKQDLADIEAFEEAMEENGPPSDT